MPETEEMDGNSPFVIYFGLELDDEEQLEEAESK